MSIVGQQVNETTVDGAGRLVSMRFQPRDGAAAAAGANAQPDAATGQQPPAQPGVQPPVVTPDEAADGGLIGPVQIEFLEGLDVIVIRGHPRDVERVTLIIEEIERCRPRRCPRSRLFSEAHSSEAMASLVTPFTRGASRPARDA